MSIVSRYWERIVEFSRTIRENSGEKIEDVYDGQILKNLAENNESILSLTINTDGVSYEKSNSRSIQPLQLICNFLPPDIRFDLRNIILSSIYCGEAKHDMLKFFEPLAEEMQKLQTIGLIINDINFKVFITHGTFDLPAKAPVQGTMQFNGYNGCGYCHHPGIAFGKTVRFPAIETEPKRRSHVEFSATMRKVHANKKKQENKKTKKKQCIDGIKGISPMIAFDGFDLVRSFGTDYMHNVLLGVMPVLLGLGFPLGKLKKTDYVLTDNGRAKLDRRILSLKLCIFFNRKPRSLTNRPRFKASEYRTMLRPRCTTSSCV